MLPGRQRRPNMASLTQDGPNFTARPGGGGYTLLRGPQAGQGGL